MIWKYFLPLCVLFFQSLDGMNWSTKVINFDQVQFFFFLWLTLLISYLRNHCITQEHKDTVDFWRQEVWVLQCCPLLNIVSALHSHMDFMGNILCQKQVMKIWGCNKASLNCSFIFQNLLPFEMPFCLIFFSNILWISGYRFFYISCQFIPIALVFLLFTWDCFVCLFVCLI